MNHEDDRRLLISFPYKEGEYKLIKVKKDSTLGKHYHRIKTENFVLIAGAGAKTINGVTTPLELFQPFTVWPGDRHSFSLVKDSVLSCVCSHPYDPNDDYHE